MSQNFNPPSFPDQDDASGVGSRKSRSQGSLGTSVLWTWRNIFLLGPLEVEEILGKSLVFMDGYTKHE
jgi:hypothetical protein